mgnify:CR=1 FL=1
MITVDKRREYYERAAAVIAADLLDFYSRAERGRKIQAGFPWMVKPAHASNVLTLKRKTK